MQRRASEAQVTSGKSSAGRRACDDALLSPGRSDRVTAAHRQQQVATARLARWLGDDARPPADRRRCIGRRRRDDASRARPAQHSAFARASGPCRRRGRRRQGRRTEPVSPNWSWEVSYAQRGSAYSNMISVGVSVPLPIARKDRQDRELAARLMQREQAREQLAGCAPPTSIRVRRAAHRVAGAPGAERKLEASLIPVTRQRVAALVAAYGSGQQHSVGGPRRAEG